MFNQLEGDGVIDNLFHLLWTKDSIFENCKKNNLQNSFILLFHKMNKKKHITFNY